MLTSDDLKFFKVIATSTSLAAAARALNVTAPTVTQRLQAIEAKLQVKLVDRQPRKTVLTDEGQLLAEGAHSILDQLSSLEASITNQKHAVSGTLKILAPLGFGNDYVAPVAAQFKQQYPQLTVELELSDTPNWNEGKSWDIIIYIGELADSSLRQVVLAPNQRFLCASPKYLANYGRPSQPTDLHEHCCIALRENQEDVTLWRFQSTQDNHVESIRINPLLASNEARVVKQWAIDGYGLIVRSEWDVIQDIEQGKLELLLTDYKLPSADIVALLNSDKTNRCARTMEFLQELRDSLTPIPWKK